MTDSPIAGVVLAAGAGTRMGEPKALVRDEGGSWLERSVRVLAEGGCSPVIAVLGAEAERAAALLGDDASVGAPLPIVAVAADWSVGVSASLRAGLAAAERTDAASALVTLVDLPALPVEAVRRLLEGAGRTALRQATYDGRPGHPVLIGRNHWESVAAAVSGDRGAGPYLTWHGADQVGCDDLWDGADVDVPGRAADG